MFHPLCDKPKATGSIITMGEGSDKTRWSGALVRLSVQLRESLQGHERQDRLKNCH